LKTRAGRVATERQRVYKNENLWKAALKKKDAPLKTC
jgi:hypothetical protein